MGQPRHTQLYDRLRIRELDLRLPQLRGLGFPFSRFGTSIPDRLVHRERYHGSMHLAHHPHAAQFFQEPDQQDLVLDQCLCRSYGIGTTLPAFLLRVGVHPAPAPHPLRDGRHCPCVRARERNDQTVVF